MSVDWSIDLETHPLVLVIQGNFVLYWSHSFRFFSDSYILIPSYQKDLLLPGDIVIFPLNLKVRNADRIFMPMDQSVTQNWVTILAGKLTLIIMLPHNRDKDIYFWCSGESQGWGNLSVPAYLIESTDGNFQQPWSSNTCQRVCVTLSAID